MTYQGPPNEWQPMVCNQPQYPAQLAYQYTAPPALPRRQERRSHREVHRSRRSAFAVGRTPN
jgi:hypothetical protein